MLLGAGRKTKEDKIDFAAGITLIKKAGESVSKGDTLCVLHTNMEDCSEAQSVAQSAYNIAQNKPEPAKYVYEVIK